jgi:hypothetical protein
MKRNVRCQSLCLFTYDDAGKVTLMNVRIALLMLALFTVPAIAQPAPATPAREIYRIHFFKAAPGKLADLLDAYLSLPTPPNTPGPMIFRHQTGDDWDLLVIYPQGAQAHIDANPNYTDAQRKLRERVMGDYIWHTDTYASGPPMADVEKALSLPKDAKGGLYLVEDYTALNGHVKQLEDVLTRDMASARAGSAVRFDHVQGAPWDFLVIFRYASWQEYVAAETDPGADDAARKQGFKDSSEVAFALREHMAAHHDTFVGRIE